LKEEEQVKVRQHIETCVECENLFKDVQRFSQLIREANQENQNPIPSGQLVNKIVEAIASENKKSAESKPKRFDLSISRYALAAVSCGILILFFSEILVPDLKSGKIQGPISNIQGAIIKSDDFRKVFTKPKEKKSMFDDCKNILSQQVDANCVKEKISKLNF
jgi:tetrahydromethanopterin S-methyltransferase subunit A